MENGSNKLDKIVSAIQMDHVVFDEICFKRKGFKSDAEGVNLSFAVGNKKAADNHYNVTQEVKADRKDEYEMTVRVTGYCTIQDDNPNLDVLLNENVVAILFPYVRAEMSLLTAQPETESLVLPVVNIHEMIKNSTPTDVTCEESASEQ